MMESMGFTYDNISSDDMGVTLVNSNSGLFKERFIPQRSITEKKVAGNSKPYFKRVEETPLSFPVTFYLDAWKDRNGIQEIARWLDQDFYKPLWLESNPDRIMYALFEGTSELLHNGCKDGYVTTNVRCNTPYMYSQPFTFNHTINGTYETYINNDGDKVCKPYLKLKKIGNGDIRIKTSVEGFDVNDFHIKDLLDGEIVDVDCINEEIKTGYESTGRYIYDNFNDDWLRFEIGFIYNGESSTKVEFIGDFEIEMTYQMVYTVG